LVERALNKGNNQFETLVVANKIAFENALKAFAPDLILCEHTLTSIDCYDAINIIKEKGLKIPIILVTDKLSDKDASEILKAGAQDYFLKDRLHRLPQAVLNAMEKSRAKQQLHESEAFNEGVLSSLSSHIAVIDENGTILAVNKAWDDFAKTNAITSLARVSKGSNYLDVCKRSVENGDRDASQALAGIQSVFKKEEHYFEMEYPCHSPEEERWFMLQISPFGEDDTKVVIAHQNITERKVAESNLRNTSVELQKTLSGLHKILNSSLDVICTVNADGEFVNVNAASKQVWGYTPEELIGTKFMNLVYHEDRDMTSKAAESFFEGNHLPLFENRYVHKSGRVVTILWSVNLDAELRLMYCVAKDVTEKKIVEKAIENERDQFCDIFLKAPSAIGVLKGKNHVFEMANPLYLQLTGKTDIIGKTLAEVLPEVVEQGIVSMLDQVYQTGESLTGTEVLAKVDTKGNGELTEFYIDFVYQAYRNDQGKIKGIFFFINDVTEKISSRRELEKSEKLFKGMIENSEDLITIINANGEPMYASPAVAKKFGYTPEEVLNLNIMEVIHPEDIPVAGAFIAELMGHPALPMTAPLIRERKKDGTYIWIEGTLTNFLETDGINAIVANFRDITERKKADEENRFKANLLNTVGQAAIATDLDGVVTYWNKAAEHMYGWTKVEAIGKHIMHLTTSENSIEQANQIMEALQKGQMWSGEFKVRKKNGTNFTALITNTPIYDDDNKLSGIIGISSDISEIKKLEELLEKTNRLAAIGSWEIDVVEGTVFWSDITKEIREVEKDYVPSLAVGIRYFEEGIHKETISQRVQECIEHGTPWDEELQIITFKGNHKWVRTIGEGEFLNGKCLRVLGSFQDITERKTVAEKVIRSEANLKVAQRIARMGSWEVAILTNEHSWSDEFYRILGISNDVIPSNEAFLSFVHPNDRAMAASTMEDAFSTFTDSSFQFRFIKKNGDIGYASSKWKFEFDSQGNPLYVYGILRNLTAEKKAERERTKMISDIVQRNSDLEQFSYIVSHNLRAPAANIIGFTEILQDELGTPQEQKELLQGLLASAISLDAVIKDINVILQIKHDAHDKKEVVTFSNLVNDIMTSVDNLIDKHHVRILTDFSEVPEIYSLKVYIYSIFYNLISNSIKYSKPNEQPIIEINSKKENGKVILRFKDNGLGIDMKTKEDKIFGLYNRFHSHVEGKGIGLFMVKTQVQSLGGKITVISELNKGTEFTIEFKI